MKTFSLNLAPLSSDKAQKENSVEASKSIVSLYKSLVRIVGHLEAKNTITDALFIALDDLHTEGLPITEENINKRLQKFAEDFEETSKTDVA